MGEEKRDGSDFNWDSETNPNPDAVSIKVIAAPFSPSKRFSTEPSRPLVFHWRCQLMRSL